MKNLALFATAAVLAPLPLTQLAAAEIEISAENPVIELSVSEEVQSAPDMATFGTGVETRAATATEALRQNSVRVRQVIDKLKAQGIADKDIQTTGINLNAWYEYNRSTQQNDFKGYVVSNQVQAKVRDIDRLGGILDAVVSSGATNLNGPWFSLDDDSEAKAEARSRAVERARDHALNYARLNGYGDVRLLSISESISNRGPGNPAPVVMARMEAADASAPVQPGQVGTAVHIAVQYEMVR